MFARWYLSRNGGDISPSNPTKLIHKSVNHLSNHPLLSVWWTFTRHSQVNMDVIHEERSCNVITNVRYLYYFMPHQLIYASYWPNVFTSCIISISFIQRLCSSSIQIYIYIGLQSVVKCLFCGKANIYTEKEKKKLTKLK